jgi:hypothetical protein
MGFWVIVEKRVRFLLGGKGLLGISNSSALEAYGLSMSQESQISVRWGS